MFLQKNKRIILGLLLLISLAVPVLAQKNDVQGTVAQRLEVMRQKLETMRRSLSGAASAMKEEKKEDKSKKDDKSNLETPLGRLKGLEKEAASLQSEVNTTRGKVERSEKYEASDVDGFEASVAQLQVSVDNALTETASLRANPTSDVGTTREVKKKKKFLGIFGGGNDEYEELIGTVTPGRDRELFIVATREVRKNNYDVGRLLFQTIITTYPDSPYLPMAKLAVADSFYLEGTTSALIQAAAALSGLADVFPDASACRPRFAENRRIRNAPNRFARPRFDPRQTRRTASASFTAKLSEYDFIKRCAGQTCAGTGQSRIA